MKDVISFCEFACLNFHIPILLIHSVKEIIYHRIIPYLESPVVFPYLVLFPLHSRLKQLENATLNIADWKFDSQEELTALDTGGAKIVFIDDLTAVPPIDVLDSWAVEKGLIIIARKD